ncbi:MAG: hypothetical protein JRN26_06535 [Nitrososphaerota archaeon]|jgi:hypothetical protein|nr:hypothetical protein [Nitrososphaerota archaeon]MDG6936519.1 hypothetical protein [Nitrososphaerota archaeon]MDG6944994.1 hypothetical protein [Nitrososphaerota archaeon]
MKASLAATITAYGAYVVAWAYVWVMRASISLSAYSALQYTLISAFNGLGAFPLYFIMKKRAGGLQAALLAVAYILYFPLAGIDWSGTIAIFTTLFLFGYYLYTVKSRFAIAIFALAAVTGWTFALVSLIFSAYLAYRDRKYISYFAVSAVSLGLYTLLYPSSMPAMGQTVMGSGLIALFLAFLPLMFTSLLDSYALLLLPLAVLALLSPGYQFPTVFYTGALSAFIPFIFISSANSIGRITKFDRNRMKVVLVLVLVNAGMLAAVYQPYSPLNQYSSINYNFGQIISNYSQEKEMYMQVSQMLKHVPPGSTVIVQETLPFTISGIAVYSMQQAPSVQNPEYVLAGPYNSYFTSGMASYAERLYDTGHYGIIAEADGMVLLGRNYTGPLEYYFPTAIFVPAGKLTPLGNSVINSGNIELTDVSNAQGWDGPLTFLPPGNYTLVIYMKQSAMDQSNSLSIAVFSDNLLHILVNHYINGSYVGTLWTKYEVNFSVNSVYQNVEVFSYINSWKGTLYVANESLVQNSPA